MGTLLWLAAIGGDGPPIGRRRARLPLGLAFSLELRRRGTEESDPLAMRMLPELDRAEERVFMTAYHLRQLLPRADATAQAEPRN